MRDRKKPSKQEHMFFFIALLFFSTRLFLPTKQRVKGRTYLIKINYIRKYTGAQLSLTYFI